MNLQSLKDKAVFVGAAVVILFVLFFFLGRHTGPRIITDLSHPTVIKEMRQLGRLETAEFTMEKVIDTQVAQSSTLKEILFGDRILLIAHGQVTAGVDLAGLSEEAVEVDGSSLTITLPDTSLFSTSLDPENTRVFDRKLGLLTRGDITLETEARKSAEGVLTSAACKAGILEKARVGAEERINQLYSLAGFASVTVRVKAGPC